MPSKTIDINRAKGIATASAPAPVLTQGDGSAPDAELKKTSSVPALSVAPVDGLYETAGDIQLPVIRAADGMTPFQAYKKPFQAKPGLASVSIVIVDYGLSPETAQSVLDEMPDGITLAMSPYANEPAKWAAAARAYGHEFWMMLPMETASFGKDDTGPETILSNANPQENMGRLKSVMGAASGYAGFITQKDHTLAQSDEVLNTLKSDITLRGLAFFESTPKEDTTSEDIGALSHNTNNLWLDADLDIMSIEKSFKTLEATAKKNGHAVAFVHPYPNVMAALKLWADTAETKGLQIAPLSAMVQ